MKNPVNKPAPANRKIEAGKATSSGNPTILFKKLPNKIPNPTPIETSARFKITFLQTFVEDGVLLLL